MRNEVWREVLDGYYEVSNIGRVRRLKPALGTRVGRLLTEQIREDGYREVMTCVNRYQKLYLVHVLVARAFIGPCPSNKEVNHKDLNKGNNCDWNLEYRTHKGNLKHAKESGANFSRDNSGERNPSAKLNVSMVERIRFLFGTGRYTHGDLAEKFGVTRSNISMIVTGKTWGKKT